MNSYRDPEKKLAPAPFADPNDADESEFAALLAAHRRAVPASARLRYTSPHPRHVTPSLVAAHRDVDVLARHVHLPVQSGSDRMLKRMIRRYTATSTSRAPKLLEGARDGPHAQHRHHRRLPGETDEDFEKRSLWCSEVGFTGLFGFKYSRRPYTPARKLDDDVSDSDKRERLAALFALSEELLQRHLVGLVGSTQTVLVEGRRQAGERRVTGRTERNEIVHLAMTDGVAGG